MAEENVILDSPTELTTEKKLWVKRDHEMKLLGEFYELRDMLPKHEQSRLSEIELEKDEPHTGPLLLLINIPGTGPCIQVPLLHLPLEKDIDVLIGDDGKYLINDATRGGHRFI